MSPGAERERVKKKREFRRDLSLSLIPSPHYRTPVSFVRCWPACLDTRPSSGLVQPVAISVPRAFGCMDGWRPSCSCWIFVMSVSPYRKSSGSDAEVPSVGASTHLSRSVKHGTRVCRAHRFFPSLSY